MKKSTANPEMQYKSCTWAVAGQSPDRQSAVAQSPSRQLAVTSRQSKEDFSYLCLGASTFYVLGLGLGPGLGVRGSRS
ncbi:GL20874 [Drosophila persimilis]|uniref:GL20874 n=1 Tax=Drosophila persimilis TaxID=7234 RepID=B4H9B9_DROPE|nr:GL20874 [Drosophila persimilis]